MAEVLASEGSRRISLAGTPTNEPRELTMLGAAREAMRFGTNESDSFFKFQQKQHAKHSLPATNINLVSPVPPVVGSSTIIRSGSQSFTMLQPQTMSSSHRNVAEEEAMRKQREKLIGKRRLRSKSFVEGQPILPPHVIQQQRKKEKKIGLSVQGTIRNFFS